MKILIIGGTGLISTAISKQLLEAGHELTHFNRGETKSRIPSDLGSKIETIIGNRKEYEKFEDAFSESTFDAVIDMVAFHPDDMPSVIRAFQGRVGQYVFCSTVCVYSGPVTSFPTTEEEPYHSIGAYGKNKAECEKVLLTAHEEKKFPVTIMRPSHSYGEGGELTRSWGPRGSFVGRMRDEKQIVVHGNGNSLWASCHVDDVARGFIATLGQEQCIGEAFHITGEEWLTWNTYYEQVAEVCGGNFSPVYIPTDTLEKIAPGLTAGTREIFMWPSIFDNSKIKSMTEYSGQTISWKEGVQRNLNWVEQQVLPVFNAEGEYEDRLIAAWQVNDSNLPEFS